MALVKMIAKDELPFSFVEAEGFLKFMQTCCPRFDVSSRRTITRDILELYQYEKGLLKSVLGASKQRVCITTDIWSSIQMSNYMVITAHFIDAEWVLHKRILSFTPIANHKGDGIGKLIETCLIDWGIERLFTITVDNASANKVAIIYVKKKLANWSVNSMVLNGLYMHVRCSAYIINLIVQDGLAEVNHSIASIRNAVKSVRSSPARLQKFKTCVDREKISYEGLMVLDVPTRWNSTYLMLHKAVVFEKAFDRMKEDDGHYVNWFVEDEGEKKMEGPPSNDDWGNARSDDLLRKMAEKMEQKFAKYWGDSFDPVNMLLFVANVLDPICKLEFVTFCFSSIYESRKVEELKSNIKELLMKLCNSYIGGSDVRNSGGFCFGDIHNGSSGGGGGGASSSIMYLILSQIAKDVLAIPVSTVASESAFSTRGCVLDPCRSSLTHKTVESLICTQNWLRSTLLGKQIIQPTQEETEFYKVIEAEFGRPIVAQQEQAAEE
ncbi:BED-type domain-containing protein [Citrus sinensis]|uniref:BED-type domain-containing protein n=1 Tax=Citrus sinensis TaxID=2711 RepID=A0ACB8L2F6_CITSI|nr:BED-type domain-containing protein [Citrus sinensis]